MTTPPTPGTIEVAGDGTASAHHALDLDCGPVSELDAVVQNGIRALYQPLVDIDRNQVVGFEALARGPVGSTLESPAALFAAARTHGRTAELDHACCAAALQGALRGGLCRPAAVFVNVEPDVIDAEIDRFSETYLHAAGTDLQIFFEVTERALTSRPAALLETVERMRAAGFGIALDDVGADRRSLALLPLLRPDVVKLDMSLVHRHPSQRSGEVMNGVYAYAERVGATIVAEGVETEKHLIAARSLGATLAQGWLLGRPGPLPARLPICGSASTLGLPPRAVAGSPVELVNAHRGVRTGRKDVLLSITRALEAQALELGEHAVVTAAFQDVAHFTPRARAFYERLAARASLTVALGTRMPELPALGVEGAALSPADPLTREWDVAVLGPHYAGAIVARDLGDDGPDHDRRFEFALTFDRDLVVEVAASLIARLDGSPPPPSPLA